MLFSRPDFVRLIGKGKNFPDLEISLGSPRNNELIYSGNFRVVLVLMKKAFGIGRHFSTSFIMLVKFVDVLRLLQLLLKFVDVKVFFWMI